MGAQSAAEPSMEDILASIRKIISEDDNDGTGIDGVADGAAGAGSSASTDLPIPAPIISKTESVGGGEPSGQNLSTASKPSNIQERREKLTAAIASASEPLSNHTDETQLAWPSVSQVPLSLAREIAAVNSDMDADAGEVQIPEPSPPHQSGQNGNTPGFAQDSSYSSVFHEDNSGDSTPSTPGDDGSLHPAIANAKAYVSAQGANKGQIKSPETPEKPMFTEASRPSLAQGSTSPEPLISPDSIERREEDERREADERRNHPLRRGDDRDESGFRNELMSPQTDHVVQDAFEQLKKTTTNGLDAGVEVLLRPMLREWLDNNLPSMVERLVRKEIERVSRGE